MRNRGGQKCSGGSVRPLEVFRARADFEMELRYAEVNLVEGAETAGSEEKSADGADRTLPREFEPEILLIHRRRRLQCRGDAVPEPFRERPVSLHDLFERFGFMRNALRFAIPESNDQNGIFPGGEFQGNAPLAVREPDPARIQAQRIRENHKPFAVIAQALIEVPRRFSSEDEVVFHIPERAVMRKPGAERLRLVQHHPYPAGPLAATARCPLPGIRPPPPADAPGRGYPTAVAPVDRLRE